MYLIQFEIVLMIDLLDDGLKVMVGWWCWSIEVCSLGIIQKKGERYKNYNNLFQTSIQKCFIQSKLNPLQLYSTVWFISLLLLVLEVYKTWKKY